MIKSLFAYVSIHAYLTGIPWLKEDFLGRWQANPSDEYVRTAKSVTMRVQMEIISKINDGYYHDEMDICDDFAKFMQTKLGMDQCEVEAEATRAPAPARVCVLVPFGLGDDLVIPRRRVDDGGASVGVVALVAVGDQGEGMLGVGHANCAFDGVERRVARVQGGLGVDGDGDRSLFAVLERRRHLVPCR